LVKDLQTAFSRAFTPFEPALKPDSGEAFKFSRGVAFGADARTTGNDLSPAPSNDPTSICIEGAFTMIRDP
jgi:hypothetical protein